MAVRVLTIQASESADRVLTPQALAFASDIHRAIAPRRDELLDARYQLQRALNRGAVLDFSPATMEIRDSD